MYRVTSGGCPRGVFQEEMSEVELPWGMTEGNFHGECARRDFLGEI